MTLQDFAALYVNYLEPFAKIAFFVIIAIVVMWFIIMVRDDDKRTGLITNSFDFLWKSVVATVTYGALGIWWGIKMLMRIVTVIFATVRDFFTSKI
jgi:hypothetical protein